jgi:hypothetical protein
VTVAELAVRDGFTPPADLPRGECIMTSLPDGGIRIDQADPRILISGELLDTVARFGDDDLAGDWLPLNAYLDMTGCMPPPYRATYVGAVLKIDGVNRTVIYRIVDYVARVHGYIGQWPD